jgi:hypothetical protein
VSCSSSHHARRVSFRRYLNLAGCSEHKKVMLRSLQAVFENKPIEVFHPYPDRVTAPKAFRIEFQIALIVGQNDRPSSSYDHGSLSTVACERSVSAPVDDFGSLNMQYSVILLFSPSPSWHSISLARRKPNFSYIATLGTALELSR